MSEAHTKHWYDLFSRGARDWLRHNQKIRETVKERLPRLIAEADVLNTSGNRTIRMPVKLLDHYRFRLNRENEQTGVGQGKGKPGDVLSSGQDRQEKGDQGGGNQDGGVEFILEMKVDEIVDWIWEELKLPELKPRNTTVVEEEDWRREGLDKRGARARLDRRRTMKEAIKRRAIQQDGPAFADEDLRFRQLRRRKQPSTRAVVLFGLDASSSMGERERVLAKTFFFWALQGVRRQYPQLETAFIGHTIEAWEFSEEEFFNVSGQGGTVASSCFNKALEIIEHRFDPSQYNIYFFYASDGENFPDDREAARQSLAKLVPMTNFTGYVEVTPPSTIPRYPETARIFDDVLGEEYLGGRYPLRDEDDIWEAIRTFFSQQAAA